MNGICCFILVIIVIIVVVDVIGLVRSNIKWFVGYKIVVVVVGVIVLCLDYCIIVVGISSNIYLFFIWKVIIGSG